MCGKKRKRPAAESEDEDDDDATPGQQVDQASPHSINLANLRGSISKPSTLIGGLTPSMEPIVVFTGATKPGTTDRDSAGKAGGEEEERARDGNRCSASLPLLPQRNLPKQRSRR